jgi:hypothetical protein
MSHDPLMTTIQAHSLAVKKLLSLPKSKRCSCYRKEQEVRLSN